MSGENRENDSRADAVDSGSRHAAARANLRPGSGNRRDWFALAGRAISAISALAIGAAGLLWAAVTGRFLVPNATAAPSRRLLVGRPEDYPPDFVETAYEQRDQLFVVRHQEEGGDEIVALSARCTHLGCMVRWLPIERRFACPCHGSGFTPEGINIEGPAPRPLERYAIRLTNEGQLEVDRDRTFQQERGQWSDPASYVQIRADQGA